MGETLCALILALSYRSRMSRARVREFLRDWLGLELSIGTLQRCIEEAAQAVAPLKDQLVDEILNSDLLHADETPHKHVNGQLLWLNEAERALRHWVILRRISYGTHGKCGLGLPMLQSWKLDKYMPTIQGRDVNTQNHGSLPWLRLKYHNGEDTRGEPGACGPPLLSSKRKKVVNSFRQKQAE